MRKIFTLLNICNSIDLMVIVNVTQLKPDFPRSLSGLG